MKIIQEDSDRLIFEENPHANLNKGAILRTVIILLFALFAGFLAELGLTILRHEVFNISINTIINALSILLVIVVYWIFNFKFYNIYGKLSPIKVKIDKKENLLSITNIIPPWFFWSWFYWNKNPIEIPIQLIKKIEYHTWTPAFYNIPVITGPRGSLGKIVFILDDNGEINVYTYGQLETYESYRNIGKKIADYIDVPFEM